MLATATLEFLKALRRNNRRDWFEAHKERYLSEFKEPGEEFARELAALIGGRLGRDMAGHVYRIHRDLRFSKDKTPYKSHLHIAVFPVGEAVRKAAFMFGLDPDGLALGAGNMGFSKAQLARFRQAVAGPEGEALVREIAGLSADGARMPEAELKRVPAPFPPEHPRAELLRRKSLSAWRDGFDFARAYGADGPINCADELTRFEPLFGWLDKTL